MIETLTKQFITRYGKKFAELNKNVYPAVKNENGTYEVPLVFLGQGGGTYIEGTKDVIQLNPPAQVQLKYKNVEGATALYRIAIPRNEAEIAAQKPEYFNYLFDEIMFRAIGNYKVTFGDENQIRFGVSFCDYKLPNGEIFIDGDDFIELRLSGLWATNKEVT